MTRSQMAVDASAVLMGLTELNTHQIDLTVANALLGNHFRGELSNCLGWPLQAYCLKALVMVQMHVHGGGRQLMVCVVQRRQALGELALMMIINV